MYIYFLIKVKQIEIIFSRLNKQSEEIKGIKDKKKKLFNRRNRRLYMEFYLKFV